MKKSYLVSYSMLFLSLIFSFSQTRLFSQSVSPFKIDSNKRSSIVELKQKNKAAHYQVLRPDVEILQKLYQSSPNSIELILPIDERRQVTLELTKATIFTSDFQVTTASNNTKAQVETGIFYKGKIKGKGASLVAISIFGNEMSGFISSSKEHFTLGKLKGTNWRNEHVIYEDSFLFQDNELVCGMIDDGQGYNGRELALTNNEALADKCVRLYIEVDYDIYSSFRASTSNYIQGLMNQVIILYQNEGIQTKVSEIKIWDVPSPYSGDNNEEMLTSFRANTGSFNGDLAQLLSFQTNDGIAASFSGLCNPDPDKSKSYSGIENTFEDVPTYSWSVFLVTHEFGHLFGSRHTHACVWNGNNTAIDGCAGFTEGDCSIPGFPSQGGTIMSYCHFSERPGIEFKEGFGYQPGNVIRGNVANSSCISACVNEENLTDAITWHNTPTTVNLGQSYQIEINYELTQPGLIQLILADEHWNKIGEVISPILGANSGIENLLLEVTGRPSANTNYLQARLLNTNWEEIGVRTIQLTIPERTSNQSSNSINWTTIPENLSLGATYAIDIDYSLEEPGIIFLLLMNENWDEIGKVWTETLLSPGSGTKQLKLTVTERPSSGKNYIQAQLLDPQWNNIGVPVIQQTILGSRGRSTFNSIPDLNTPQNATLPSLSVANSVTTSSTVRILPNPVINELTLEIPSKNLLKLTIFDVLGKKLYSDKKHDGGTIDVSFLKPNLYFLRIEDKASNTYEIRRFIKK